MGKYLDRLKFQLGSDERARKYSEAKTLEFQSRRNEPMPSRTPQQEMTPTVDHTNYRSLNFMESPYSSGYQVQRETLKAKSAEENNSLDLIKQLRDKVKKPVTNERAKAEQIMDLDKLIRLERSQNPQKVQLANMQEGDAPPSVDKLDIRLQNIDRSLKQSVYKENLRGAFEMTGYDPVKERQNRTTDADSLYNVKEGWIQGQLQNWLGNEYYRKMMGLPNQADKIEKFMQDHPELEPSYSEKGVDNFLKRATRGIAEQSPLWIGGAAEGIKQAPKYMAGFAGTAAAAGVASPLMLTPEEVVTVPGAAILGFKFGMGKGFVDYVARQEAGQAYQQYITEGVDPEIARPLAQGVGAFNGLLEIAQINTAIKPLPGIKNFIDAAKKKVVSETAKKLGRIAASYGSEVAENVIEEMIQEGATLSAGELAKAIHQGKTGEQLQRKTFKDIAGDVLQVGLQSAIDFSLMPIGGVVTGMGGIAVEKAQQIETKKQQQKAEASFRKAIFEDVPGSINEMKQNIDTIKESDAISMVALDRQLDNVLQKEDLKPEYKEQIQTVKAEIKTLTENVFAEAKKVDPELTFDVPKSKEVMIKDILAGKVDVGINDITIVDYQEAEKAGIVGEILKLTEEGKSTFEIGEAVQDKLPKAKRKPEVMTAIIEAVNQVNVAADGEILYQRIKDIQTAMKLLPQNEIMSTETASEDENASQTLQNGLQQKQGINTLLGGESSNLSQSDKQNIDGGEDGQAKAETEKELSTEEYKNRVLSTEYVNNLSKAVDKAKVYNEVAAQANPIYKKFADVVKAAAKNPLFNGLTFKFIDENTKKFWKRSELDAAGYKNLEEGEYEIAGSQEGNPDSGRTITFYRQATKDTIAEEIIHDLQRRIEDIDPELQQDIESWEENVREQAASEGFEIPEGYETFAQALVFSEMGYADANPDLAELFSVPDEIVDRINALLGEDVVKALTGNSMPEIHKSIRLLNGKSKNVRGAFKAAEVKRINESIEAMTERAHDIDFRTFESVGGKGKVKSIMELYPEFASYYQAMAKEFLKDLGETTKAEYTHKRFTSESIARILNNAKANDSNKKTGISYEAIQKALEAMAEGKANTALSRRIELVMDDNLSFGYRNIHGEKIPANQEYLKLKYGDNGEAASYQLKPWTDQQQEISSADTSINATRLPSTFNRVKFEQGTVNADIGGGRFDNATEYLKSQGVENIIYDPFNRDATHNEAAIEKIKGGQADTATVNNVLNVIKEAEAREQVISNAADAVKPEGTAYFLIYEGDNTGESKATSKGWQENRNAKSYISEIQEYFEDVASKSNLIIAKKPKKGIKTVYQFKTIDELPFLGVVDENGFIESYNYKIAKENDFHHTFIMSQKAADMANSDDYLRFVRYDNSDDTYTLEGNPSLDPFGKGYEQIKTFSKHVISKGVSPDTKIVIAEQNLDTEFEGKTIGTVGQFAEGKIYQLKPADISNFKTWFGESKVVDEEGNPKIVYSGHSNVVLYGTKFDPKKATAGGFFSTEDPDIASNYALGKMGNMEVYENGDQYRIYGKNGKPNKKLWQIDLTPEQQQKALEFIAGHGTDFNQYIRENMKHDAQVRQWYYRGGVKNLFNIWQFMDYMGDTISYDKREYVNVPDTPAFIKQDTSTFEDLLNELGMKWESYHKSVPGVFPIYLKIENPVDTTQDFPKDLMEALEKVARRERRNPDYDTKWTSEYPMKDWVADIKEMDETGEETFWATQIPKKAVDIFKAFGYDGIKDKGGKMGGQEHAVWIAFDPEQIKSAFNKGGWDPENPNMNYQLKPVNTFYSQLQRTIESKMPRRATVDTVRGLIKNVKAEEVKWSGIEDFLEGKEIVDKDELLEYLKANELKIEEVVHGETAQYTPEASILVDDFADALRNNTEELEAIYEEITGKEIPEEVMWADDSNKLYRVVEKAAKGTDKQERVSDLVNDNMRVEVELDRLRETYWKKPKFEKYTLPGGSNYREMLFTLPTNMRDITFEEYIEMNLSDSEIANKYRLDKNKYDLESFQAKDKMEYDFFKASFDNEKNLKAEWMRQYIKKPYKSSHWDEPNVLAHTRLQDFTDAEGRNVLFVEEVQSDWHQEGRKKGYRTPESVKKAEEERAELEKQRDAIIAKYSETGNLIAARQKMSMEERVREHEISDRLAKLVNVDYQVPDAPFQKTWHEFVLKRLIRYAVDNGYDAIAWTTGEQQAERYDLSKQIKMVSAIKNNDGSTYNLIVEDKSGNEISPYSGSGKKVTPAEMEEVIGKDLTKKLIEGADQSAGKEWKKNMPVNPAFFTISGIDLKIGGEGMKGFYDKMIPTFLQKYLKKWGVELQGITFGKYNSVASKDARIVENEDDTYSVVDEVGNIMATFDDLYIAESYIESREDIINDKTWQQPGFYLNDAMKQSAVYEGQPLYQLKAARENEVITMDVMGRKIPVIKNPTIDQMRYLEAKFKEDNLFYPPDEPKTRVTYDEQGNEYRWVSTDSYHSAVEMYLNEERGIRANQRWKWYQDETLYQLKEANFDVNRRGFFNSVEDNPITDPALREELKQIAGLYVVKHNQDTINEALQMLYDMGTENAISWIMGNTPATAEMNVVSQLLIKQAMDHKNYDTAIELIDATAKKATTQGQAIQTLSLFGRMTPEGIIRYTRKTYQKLLTDGQINEVNAKAEELGKQLNDVNKKAVEDLDVTDELKKISEMTPEEMLARRISNTLKDKETKEYNPIKVMVDTLFKVYKEHVELDKEKPIDHTLEFIAQAITQREKYREVWNEAMEIVKEKFKDDPNAEAILEDYFQHILTQTFPDSMIQKAVKTGLRDLKVKIDKIVRKHFTEIDKTTGTLAEKLAAEAGLNGYEAMMLEDYIRKTMDKLTADAKTRILERMFKDKSKTARERNTIAQRILEMSNLGALKGKKYKDLIAVKLGLPALTDEMIDSLDWQAQKIQTMPEGHEKDLATAKMLDTIAAGIPVSLWRKVNTLQTMAQLLNPKTIIRNLVGNTVFQAIERTSRLLQIPMDAFVGDGLRVFGVQITKGTGIRTKTFIGFTPLSGREGSLAKKFGGYLSDVLMGEGFKNGWDLGLQDALAGVDTSGLETQYDLPNRRTFRAAEGKPITNMLSGMETAMNIALRVTDRAAFTSAFTESLNEQLKISGLQEATEEMVQIATATGLYRTFQDANKISEFFVGMKRTLNKVGTEEFGLGDLILKYPKTPGNLLARVIDYSPLGVINVAFKLLFETTEDPTGKIKTQFRSPGRLKYETNANKHILQKMAIEGIGRAITGTALITAGMIVAKAGILSGGGDDDWDVYYMNQLAGLDNFQVNTSALLRWISSGFKTEYAERQEGDRLVSYDWMQPFATNIVVGADLALRVKSYMVIVGNDKTNTVQVFEDKTAANNFIKQNPDKGYKVVASTDGIGFIGALVSAIQVGSETLANQPLLSGIRKAFGSRDPVAGALEVVQSAPAGFIPTFFSQLSQILDIERKSTYDITWEGETLRLMQRKVPVLSSNLEPSLDVLGDRQAYYDPKTNPIMATLYTFLSPAFVKKYKPSPEAKFLLDLYEEYGDKRTVPKKVKNKITVEGITVKLTPAELTALQEYSGSRIKEEIAKEQQANTRSLSEEQKIKRIDKIYDEVYNEVKEKLRSMRGIPKKKP